MSRSFSEWTRFSSKIIGTSPSRLGFRTISVLPFPASYFVLISYLLCRECSIIISTIPYAFSMLRSR